MRAHPFHSSLRSLCILLVVVVLSGHVEAVEIHAVGDAACKYVDSEWIQTASERMGNMTAVWAFSENDIFIGNEDGAVYHYDGSTWSELYHCPSYNDVFDIWGTSGSNIYVCFGSDVYSNRGTLRHFDGSDWSDISMPSSCDYYSAVFGFDADDIYVVGHDSDLSNLIFHNGTGDPQSWDPVDISSLGIDMSCTGVWGSSGTDVFITGSLGEIIRWNGSIWEQMTSGVTTRIYDIWGASDNDVFAVVYNSVIHYDGIAWTAMSIPSSTQLRWITGVSDSDVLVGGYENKVLYYNGSGWAPRTGDDYSHGRDAFMFSGDNALIVSSAGILFEFTGSAVVRCDLDWGYLRSLHCVTCTPEGIFYSAGDEGFVYRYDGSSWIEFAQPTTDQIRDIVAFADDDICVLTDAQAFHFDGISWAPMGVADMGCINAWGLSSDNLYTADGASIYHYDGYDWTRVWYQPCIEYNEYEWRCDYVYDIWGTSDSDIYAVGTASEAVWVGPGSSYFSCSIIVHFDGVDWTYQTVPIGCPTWYPPSDDMGLCPVWGSGSDDIWAAGKTYDPMLGYSVLHSGGTSWGAIEATDANYSAIWGDSAGANIYFLVGGKAIVHHYDGVDWSSIEIANVVMRDMWGTDITLTPAEMPSSRFELTQNYPNPFNPNTTISFSLHERAHISLAIYDVAGRLVRVLADKVMEVGPHVVTWNGKDGTGRTVASGVYFYRLEAGEFTETKKMVLLR